jgi:hypothetical protein
LPRDFTRHLNLAVRNKFDELWLDAEAADKVE